MNNKGKFITLEGGEGSGKTTMMMELKQTLEKKGLSILTTREPGGIEIAESIRNIILDPSNKKMHKNTEMLLYAAARTQHVEQKIKPALRKGIHVLCDRFIDSSMAYQGYARGIGVDHIYNINCFATKNIMPDITFYLDLEPEIGLKRIAEQKQREVNRLDLEDLSFHAKVREGYLLLAKKHSNRIVTIDANKTPKEMIDEVIFYLKQTVLKEFMT